MRGGKVGRRWMGGRKGARRVGWVVGGRVEAGRVEKGGPRGREWAHRNWRPCEKVRERKEVRRKEGEEGWCIVENPKRVW